MDNTFTVMHAIEHCSTLSTAMKISADSSNQDYECCECCVTLGNESKQI